MEENSPRLAAIVLAAGQGKRMGSSLAKVLHPLGGKPLIQHVVTSARKISVNPIVLVVGHQAEAVQAEFGKDEKDIFFALQAEQLGTGHATSIGVSAIPQTSGDVLVLCGDVPLLRPETLHELVDLHRKEGAVVTVLTAIMEDPSGYGRMLREGGPNGRVVGIKEDGLVIIT